MTLECKGTVASSVRALGKPFGRASRAGASPKMPATTFKEHKKRGFRHDEDRLRTSCRAHAGHYLAALGSPHRSTSVGECRPSTLVSIPRAVRMRRLAARPVNRA